MTRAFPVRAAAALFLERQHLDRPLGRRLTAASLTRFAEDTGGIQLDTINVVERAHHLTLWSRFGPYERKTLDRLIYRRRALFEYWAHAACLVPTAHLAAWRRPMLDYAERPHYASWRRWLQRHRRVVEEVLEAVRARGPLANADFEHERRRPSGGWWDRKPQGHALEWLWMTGQIAVHSRVHFQKRYDLTERIVGDRFQEAPPDRAEFRRWHLRQSLHAMGAAAENDLSRYLTFPGMPIAERRAALRELIATGEVTEIAVQGAATGRSSPRWFALTCDLGTLERAARRRAPSDGTTLLSPFDSLLWHRDRVRRLFGYDYTIEVYVPAPKRTHGYYSLPIFHRGLLIGRLDPKTHRDRERLEVKAVHFEPWFVQGGLPPAAAWGAVDRDRALMELAAALRSLALFVGATEVSLGAIRPKSLAPALRRALASSPAAPELAPARS